MSIHVALHHKTNYRYDIPVSLSPHEVRLRPAAHCRTPILSYSLKIAPKQHFINWQQDAYGNFVARLVFPDKARELEVTVDLIAEMTVINPFDFFVEKYAEHYPFAYPDGLRKELAPFLEVEESGPLLVGWLGRFRADGYSADININDFLVKLNRCLQADIVYLVRMEHGVQSCEETLGLKSGSCRDSAWLLANILRHMGLAARFVSGYLIQLKTDIKSLDGPSGPDADFTDLHAWTEVYVPGAGWIGLDPTSGLLAGEGHIPLACTAMPISAAPIVGYTEVCKSTFGVSMAVTRMREDPRVTKPYTEAQWQDIVDLGHRVDAELSANDVRLTQGGEPTFVSIDDMEADEWNVDALGPQKLKLGYELIRRLQARFAPGALLHFGQGKWYPGEPLPRWALACYWRTDGREVWRHDSLRADENADYGVDAARAMEFGRALAEGLGLTEHYLIPAFEDVLLAAVQTQTLPINVEPPKRNREDAGKRDAFAPEQIAGYVLPLRAREAVNTKASSRSSPGPRWISSRWPLRRERLYLIPGDSPMGARLPLASLPKLDPEDEEAEHARDPFEERGELDGAGEQQGGNRVPPKPDPSPREIVRTALCLEPRHGCLHVFMPPVQQVEDYLALVTSIENTAAACRLPVLFEGYPPPVDACIYALAVTPDPGVIEVNVHPATSWDQLIAITTTLYDEARLCRLATEKFMVDGRHTGTGGGNHITLGGPTAADSPLLRRPDLLQSLVTYWQNHPALSYLFSGAFIGPTSQAPRVDEARDDNLYELEIAFQQLQEKTVAGYETERPWLTDRLLRNLLVDLTGNTHRAEFSIDKLYSPTGPTGRLGLVEFRAFEMPPHARMSLVQMLLLRALVARFWKTPYRTKLVLWGTRLHDSFMLPHFIAQDMTDVVRDLNAAAYSFRMEWFAPFFEFRFPLYGTVAYEGISLELRQAIEPWNVLGEQMQTGATARYVDSSVERLQVKVSGAVPGRHVIACNGRPLPLHPTGIQAEFVAGVRYQAWNPPSSLHPTIPSQAPLTFDIVDTWSGRAIGGCTYHVSHPGGRAYETPPVNALEAEARRMARFWPHGHSPGPMVVPAEPLNPNFPMTLDLRKKVE